jgi:hypothetical protein
MQIDDDEEDDMIWISKMIRRKPPQSRDRSEKSNKPRRESPEKTAGRGKRRDDTGRRKMIFRPLDVRPWLT